MPAQTYSVIIPAFNAAATVGRAIDSAVSQTLPPAEVVVVDDGSRDDTFSAASKFGGSVKVIRQTNAGPGAARNRAVSESTGEWLAFLDADDSWLPHKMERQFKSDADLIHSAAQNPRKWVPHQSQFIDLFKRNCIISPSVVMRRKVFDAVGGFNEDRALIGTEDYNLWLRVAAAGYRIEFVPECLVNYTRAPDSLTSNSLKFVGAELANMRDISERCRVDPAAVRQRIIDIHVEYGRDLFVDRQLKAARRLLSVPLLQRASPEVIVLWLATWAPRWLLDLRRRLRHSSVTATVK